MIYIEDPSQDTDVKSKVAVGLTDHIVGLHGADKKRYERETRYLERMQLHTEGRTTSAYAQDLLERQRPNELAEVRTYRIANLDAITKSAYGKVENVLRGIFNPEVYGLSFNWDNENVASTPQRYFTEDFPIDEDGNTGNIVTWAKDVLIHASLTDPNGVCLLWPMGKDDKGWPVWMPKIINCDKIIHYGDYWLFKEGASVIYVDSQSIWQIYRNGNETVWDLIHQSQEPVQLVKRLPYSVEGHRRVSYIDPVLPFWEKAMKDDSDKTAAKTLHAHPKWWEYQMPCSAPGCVNGVTYMTMEGRSINEPCKVCSGSGIQKFGGPFGIISVTKEKGGEQAPPFAGYIDPPKGILEFMASEIRSEIDEGFSAINMEFLRRTEGANESGYAKDLSRAELTTFMLNFSQSIFSFLDWVTTTMTFLRYGATYSGWRDYAPVWSAPTNFGIVTAATTMERIKTATEAKISPAITAQMGYEFAEMEFGGESLECTISKLALKLDPLIGMSEDTIATLGGEILPNDLWIHANFRRMVLDAIDEVSDWPMRQRKEQMKWLYTKAGEERKANIVPIDPAV